MGNISREGIGAMLFRVSTVKLFGSLNFMHV